MSYFNFLAYRNKVKAENAKSEIIKNSLNPKVTLIECNLVSLDSVSSFVKAFKEMNLPLALLINNAGLSYARGRRSKDGFELNMAVNYVSHCVLTEQLLPLMNAEGKDKYGARIINTSSVVYYAGTKRF